MTWLSRFPVLLRAVCALTLGLVLAGAGAAHRPVETPTQLAAMAAFVAAGGSLGDLCHDASGHGGEHMQRDCPACTLSGAMVLPAVAEVSFPLPVLAQRGFWPVQVAAFLATSHTPVPPARGPPRVMTA